MKHVTVVTKLNTVDSFHPEIFVFSSRVKAYNFVISEMKDAAENRFNEHGDCLDIHFLHDGADDFVDQLCHAEDIAATIPSDTSVVLYNLDTIQHDFVKYEIKTTDIR